jgi:hypothetical protein
MGESVQLTTGSRGARISGHRFIIFGKYSDHSLKMSLRGGKKRVKGSGKREMVCKVCKFRWSNTCCNSLFNFCQARSVTLINGGSNAKQA